MYRKLLVLAVVVLMGGCSGKARQASNPSASGLLRRTAQAYASCRSYRDTGAILLKFSSGGDSSTARIRFSTVFRRPDRFRFEHSGDAFGSFRQVVWTSGGKAHWWSTVDSKVRTEGSLASAIAGATGVSLGAAHTVPRLLMPNGITGWAVTDLVKPRLAHSQRIQGMDCFEIEGSDHSGDRVILWISKRDHLIRRILQQFKDGSQETTYKAEANVPLPSTAFQSRIGQ